MKKTCAHSEAFSLGMYRTVNRYVVVWNRWLILLFKIWYFFYFCRININKFLKFLEFQICAYFLSGLSVCWVISNFLIFQEIKVGKYIWDPWCHMVAETGSWFLPIRWLSCWLEGSASSVLSCQYAQGAKISKVVAIVDSIFNVGNSIRFANVNEP